jgi:hypothetical protein
MYKIKEDEKRNRVDIKRQSEIEMIYYIFCFVNQKQNKYVITLKKKLYTSLTTTRKKKIIGKVNINIDEDYSGGIDSGFDILSFNADGERFRCNG